MSGIKYAGKCMVCGSPAELCCPLTFCPKCMKTKEADEVRKRHRDIIKKIIKEGSKTSLSSKKVEASRAEKEPCAR